MTTGKLYKSNDNEYVTEVNYHFHDESDTSWWGELTLNEYKNISDGEGFIIELEDKRKGRCHLHKRVNMAVSGIPPRYTYHFTGLGPLQ